MKFKIFISFLYLLLSTHLSAQITDAPCADKQIELINLGTLGNVSQSSTHIYSAANTGDVNRSIDGITEGDESHLSSTNTETNPWWEINLNDSYLLSGLKIWYPENHYPDGFQNYYLLLSEFPFSSTDLNATLASPLVEHVFVSTALPNGFEIPLEFREAQYVRIQMEGDGGITVFEIQISGGGGFDEICDNGIDDDCDGKIDCQDTDCAPVIFSVNTVDPTCPICDDGEISVQAFGDNLSYSLDGGITFINFPPPTQIRTFDQLLEGTYDLVLTNGICTVSYVNNPIILQAPEGLLNDCCENGEFEFGLFDNWTGGLGMREAGGPDVIIDNLEFLTESENDFISDSEVARQYIISQTSGYLDPIINDLPLFGGNSGMYLARLGNSSPGREAERLTYCFEVTDCNSQLYFNYKVVLEDHDHPENEQPFFQYKLIDQSNNDAIIAEERIVADRDNDFFKEIPSNNDDIILYTDWACVDIDLSNVIGHQVCIEFITSDCAENAHFGYAYIDDLCRSLEAISPFIELNIDEIVCANEAVVIDATNSDSYNQYAWEVCKLDANDQELDCVSMPLTIGEITSLFDIASFYENSGNTFDCNQSYRVRLTLANACTGEATVFKDFYLDCDDDDFIDYKDIVLCGLFETDVLIEGNGDCDGCGYTWTPAGFLNNASLEFPTILSSLYALALSTDYEVMAKNEVGCTFSDTIEITQLGDISLTAKVDTNYCEYVFYAEINSTQAIPVSVFDDLLFINESQGESYSGTLQNEAGEAFSTSWIYTLEDITFKKNTMINDVWKVQMSFGEETLTLGNCMLEDYVPIPEPSNLYFGAFFFQIPRGFVPNGDMISERFGPMGLYDDYGEMNAYAGRMKIFNEWGAKVWDSGLIETSPVTPLDRSQLYWDGNTCDNNGNCSILPGVYFYTLELENCENPLGTMNHYTRWCFGTTPVYGEILCDDHEDCNGDPAVCEGWPHGDVTLIL